MKRRELRLWIIEVFIPPSKVHYYAGRDGDRTVFTPVPGGARKYDDKEEAEGDALVLTATDHTLIGRLSVTEHGF